MNNVVEFIIACSAIVFAAISTLLELNIFKKNDRRGHNA